MPKHAPAGRLPKHWPVLATLQQQDCALPPGSTHVCSQVGVATQVNTKPNSGGDSRAVRLIAGFHAGVADTPAKPCVPGNWKTDSGGCNMDHPAQHEVTANTFTNDIQYTNVR